MDYMTRIGGTTSCQGATKEDEWVHSQWKFSNRQLPLEESNGAKKGA
jgi:hypothetical protein